MEKRKYKDIQIIEVFHESKRQKICEYKSLIKENCFEGTQVFEYDEAGNLLKRTVIQNHSGSGQLRECCFAYDEEKRIIAYKEVVNQDNGEQIVTINRVYMYEADGNEYILEKGEALRKRYFVYCKGTKGLKEDMPSERELFFKMDTIIMKDRQKQLYYLPNGALSFQRIFYKEKGKFEFLNPAGEEYKWALGDIDDNSALVYLYEPILTLEIYQQIVLYCKKISPKLDFISFSPECFVEPNEECNRIMNWIAEVDVWYGIC